MEPGKLIDRFQFQDNFFFHDDVQSEAINSPIVIENLKFLLRFKRNFLFLQFQEDSSLISFLPKTRPERVMDSEQHGSNPVSQFLK